MRALGRDGFGGEMDHGAARCGDVTGELRDVGDAVHRPRDVAQQRQPIGAHRRVVGHDQHVVEKRSTSGLAVPAPSARRVSRLAKCGVDNRSASGRPAEFVLGAVGEPAAIDGTHRVAFDLPGCSGCACWRRPAPRLPAARRIPDGLGRAGTRSIRWAAATAPPRFRSPCSLVRAGAAQPLVDEVLEVGTTRRCTAGIPAKAPMRRQARQAARRAGARSGYASRPARGGADRTDHGRRWAERRCRRCRPACRACRRARPPERPIPPAARRRRTSASSAARWPPRRRRARRRAARSSGP